MKEIIIPPILALSNFTISNEYNKDIIQCDTNYLSINHRMIILPFLFVIKNKNHATKNKFYQYTYNSFTKIVGTKVFENLKIRDTKNPLLMGDYMMMTTLMPKSKIRALQIAKEMLSKIISMKGDTH